MSKLQKYVSVNCPRELNEVRNSAIADVDSKLSIEERTLIYKYTEDGYENLNENLRISEGREISEFGRLLKKTIDKLPDYQDLCYRSVNLTPHEFQKYSNAKNNNGILVEHSFISTSKSKAIAYGFGKNYQFRIFSRTGKLIEEFAKFGKHHPQNEKEVLFKPGTKFSVLEITIVDQSTLITLEEITK